MIRLAPSWNAGAYQDFLTLWKDADSDIPVLKQAKAEYAKLPPTADGSRNFLKFTSGQGGG